MRARLVLLLAVCSCSDRCGDGGKPATDVAATPAPSSAAIPEATPPPFEACRGILLIDARAEILSFSPAARSLTRLARASCDFGTDTGPRTMAVDGDGTIWTATYEGRIVRVHAADGACERTPFVTTSNRLDLTSVLEGSDPVLYAADDRGLLRVERASLAPELLMKANLSLLAGAYAQRGASIVKIDLAKKKVETVASIDQRAPMALFDGALFLFQGSEGLTRQERTAGGLRFDPKSKTWEPVLDVVERTFVAAGACPTSR